MVDPWDDRSLSTQIADDIAGKIASGEYAPGQRLPSQTSMVQEYAVARETVRRALAELRRRGLVVSPGNRGTFVRPADQE